MTDMNRKKMLTFPHSRIEKLRKNPERYHLRLTDVLKSLGVDHEYLGTWRNPDGYWFRWTVKVYLTRDRKRFGFIEFFGKYREKGSGGTGKYAKLYQMRKQTATQEAGIPMLWLRRLWVQNIVKNAELQQIILIWMRKARSKMYEPGEVIMNNYLTYYWT